MSPSVLRISIFAAALLLLKPAAFAFAADAERGKAVFRACIACHSLEPGEHRTGPSLAGIVGRRAGAAKGFDRYSEALRAAGLIWDEQALDAFLAAPMTFLPGNRMTFRGLPEVEARQDLIAYLGLVGQRATADAPGPDTEMMAPPERADLKAVGPEAIVTAIRYCDDTYQVTTASGETIPFWEFNLRFKTDSGDKGPRPRKPALLPASMMGDRAFVIFADPDEISALIEKRC